MWRFTLAALTLVALALRTHSLGDVPLRWDEGWSIALAALSPSEMVRLTALDVHPPLYYALLSLWQQLGAAEAFWVRLLSVLAATLAVPTAAAAAAAWWRTTPSRPGARGHSSARLAGCLAAGYVAIAPALIYYSGVTRMYALTTAALLVSTWGLAHLGQGGSPGGPSKSKALRGAAAAFLGSIVALYTFYYTGFALAGLYVASLIAWPRAWRRILTVGFAAGVAYVPWLLIAGASILQRTEARSTGAGLGLDLASASRLLDDGLCAALMCDPPGLAAAWAAVLVIIVGAALARPVLAKRLGIVVLPVLATLVGAALGAQAHMFAARYTIAATPFLGLGFGWAVAGLTRRHFLAGLAGALLILGSTVPVLTTAVYSRSAEVTDPYDPSAEWRQLASHSNPNDLVVFNILSLAGAYEAHRTRDDPPWTYAQAWDPVHEPLEVAKDRIAEAAHGRSRVWLVLYKGIAAADSAALKEWLDATLYPSGGWWSEDTWYLGYVVAEVDEHLGRSVAFEGGIVLTDASFTSLAEAGSGIGVELGWRTTTPQRQDERVFVHAYDESGHLVAQHDAYPAADGLPTSKMPLGVEIRDRHGLWIPEGVVGPLRLVAGLYDPQTGVRRGVLAGGDSVELGYAEAASP